MCKLYTSVGCAACYIVISVWGIVMLGIMAILFGIDKSGNIGELKHTRNENFKTLWINVIMYFILCIICTFTLFYRLKHPFPEEGVVEEENSEDILDIKKEPVQENLEDEKLRKFI